MSWLSCPDPDNRSCDEDVIETVIVPRAGDIGNFTVYRALPFSKKRMVGPFIFWDQMGPGEFLTGQGVDVRPHPHIGLSTLTYLFDGSMDHKDSLGNDLRIKPGELNLMSAGHGIVHSERTGQDIREGDSALFGIQSWIAQSKAVEDSDPAFVHFDTSDIPTFEDKGLKGSVILGDFHGVTSPVKTDWETLYVDILLEPGETLKLPNTTEERALYVVQGNITIASEEYPSQQMVVLKPGLSLDIQAKDHVRLMLLGGAAMDGPRHIWWNFVSSSKEKLEAAKSRWKSGQFPTVPGDDKECIPLPQ